MFLLLFLLFVLSEAASASSVKPVVVQVRPGDDVILPCQTAEASIRVVQWTRDDLKTEYVLLYRSKRFDPTHQHPSYKGRVELVDSQLKPGDVSLILKNVSSSDPGTYKCRVAAGGSGRQKRAIIDTEPIRLISLQITGSASSVKPVVFPAKPGDDVILPCQTAEASIRAVEWTRADLKTEYVLLYRDGHQIADQQHPSYQGRVELVDSQLKPGDVSLILKNVSSNDFGTYECRVAAGGSRRKRALIDTEPIRLISLEVTGSDSHKGDNMNGDQTSDSPEDRNQSPGHAGLAAGVLLLLAVGAVGVVMFLRTRRRREAVRTSETPDADEAAVVVLP